MTGAPKNTPKLSNPSPPVQNGTARPEATIGLSNAGARRAAAKLSLDGQAMLFAMMRFVMLIDTDRLVLGDASRDAGLSDDAARRGIGELQSCKLLAADADGTISLHLLFASTGHSWRRNSTGKLKRSEISNVVSLPATKS